VRALDGSYSALYVDQVLQFRLRANPTKRLARSADGRPDRLLGKRVQLLREDEQLGWLRRKAESGGFALLNVRTAQPAVVIEAQARAEQSQIGWRATKDAERRRLTFGSVLFEGRLRITEVGRFRETLATGIGSGKAYGFGLLSIRGAAP
jgi:CRISPR system Cascade subunit CasE